MTAYARVYVAGVTDAVNGQGPGISAWIGYSSNNTDPSGSGWTWVPATFNQQFGNDDEYRQVLVLICRPELIIMQVVSR